MQRYPEHLWPVIAQGLLRLLEREWASRPTHILFYWSELRSGEAHGQRAARV